MCAQTIDHIARDLLASALVGDDWLLRLDPLMEHMNSVGGGPARTVAPKMYAMPTSGLRDLFAEVRAGRSPPLTKVVTVPASANDGFVPDYAIHTREARYRDPFVSEFLRSRKLHHQASAFLDDTREGAVRLLIFRNEHQGRFEKEELARFAQTLPYLRSAAMVSRARLRTMAKHQAEPFVLRGEPVMFVDYRGRVAEINEAAQRLKDGPLTCTQGRLATWRSAEQSRFDAALTAALVHGKPRLMTLAARFKSVMALILPVEGEAKDLFDAVAALVVLIDPERDRRINAPVASLLQQAAGLTARETDAVRLVGAGQSPKLAAQNLGISSGTLRNYLKQAFAKLDVHSQGELIALISRISS